MFLESLRQTGGFQEVGLCKCKHIAKCRCKHNLVAEKTSHYSNDSLFGVISLCHYVLYIITQLLVFTFMWHRKKCREAASGLPSFKRLWIV